MKDIKELNKEQLEIVIGGENATPKGWEDNLNYPIENGTDQPANTDFRCPESL